MIDKKIIKAAGIVGVGNVIGQVVAFLFFVILAWICVPKEYGYIRYVVQSGTFLATIVAAGYPAALARFIAASKGDKNEASIYFVNSIFGMSVILIIVIPLSLILYDFNLGVIAVVVGFSASLIYLGLIRGFIDYKKIALFNILRNLIKIILVSLIIIFPLIYSTSYVILVYSFGGLISIGILESLRPIHINISFKKISKLYLKKLTKFSVYTFIGTLSYSAITYIGYIVLNMNYNYTTIAYYSVALTLSMIFLFVPQAVNTILMPKIASLDNTKKRIKYLKAALLLTLLSGALLYILTLLWGKLAIKLVFGEKYIKSYEFLLITSIGVIFSGLRDNFSSLWLGINKPEIGAVSLVVGAVVTAVTNFSLINIIGPFCAAYGYTLGFLSALLVNIVIFLKSKDNL